jgi:hypothetical protein
MAVIINDFQIDIEPPPQSQTRGDSSSDQAPAQGSTLKPEEIKTVITVNQQRMERVRAD